MYFFQSKLSTPSLEGVKFLLIITRWKGRCLEWTLFVCAALGGLPKVLMKEGISRISCNKGENESIEVLSTKI